MTQPQAPAFGPPPLTDTALATVRQYQSAADNAKQNFDAASKQVDQLQQQLANTPPQAGGIATEGGGTFGAEKNPAYDAIVTQLNRAYASQDAAAREYQSALTNLAAASDKAAQQSDPQNRDILNSTANKARSDATTAATQAAKTAADFQEWQDAAPDRKAQVAANQRLTNLQADSAEFALNFKRETDPKQKELLQQQIDANAQAIDDAKAAADLAKKTAGSKVTVATEGASQAEIKTKTDQANLDDILRRIRQAPTDEQARAALEQALQQGQANLEATQQGTATQRALLPGQVAQQGAALANTQAQTAQTQAQTQAAQRGTLANLDEFIAAQKDAIAKGYIKDLRTGPNGEVYSPTLDAALAARLAGTTPMEAAKTTLDVVGQNADRELRQREQSIALLNQRSQAGTSILNNVMGLANNPHFGIAGAPNISGLPDAISAWATDLGGGQQAFNTAQNDVAQRVVSNLVPGGAGNPLAAKAYGVLSQALGAYRAETGQEHPLATQIANGPALTGAFSQRPTQQPAQPAPPTVGTPALVSNMQQGQQPPVQPTITINFGSPQASGVPGMRSNLTPYTVGNTF